MNEVADVSIEEKAPRLPPAPRLILNGWELVPAMDDQWQVRPGIWALPGRRVCNYFEVVGIAQRNNWSLYLRQTEVK
jgi:hypothetical protein